MKHQLRVGFVLCSSASAPIPSTRIAVLNLLPYLEAAGIESLILFNPERVCETPNLAGIAQQAVDAGCDVVVLQKVHGPSAVELATSLSQAGVPTIYAVCDRVIVPMAEACNATVAVTDYLRSLYPVDLQPRIYVVHDGIERPAECKSDWGSQSGPGRSPLRGVLVTSSDLDRLPVIGRPPPWLKVRIVGRYSRGIQKWRETRWKYAGQAPARRLAYLRFLLDPQITCIAWDGKAVYQELKEADIGLLPIDTSDEATHAGEPPAWEVKSENRLTLKMSIGLPVIATPIPAYEAIIEHGVNGFFARSPLDWALCFDALRDPARRRAMGMAARKSVMPDYSMGEQADKLVNVLAKVSADRRR